MLFFVPGELFLVVLRSVTENIHVIFVYLIKRCSFKEKRLVDETN